MLKVNGVDIKDNTCYKEHLVKLLQHLYNIVSQTIQQ